MAAKVLSGKKFFYAMGQSVRARGLPKDYGIDFYKLDSAEPYARIAFDAGFRGLAL